jgi:RHS repeat-associated protein
VGGDDSDPFGYKAQWGYYTDEETKLILCSYRYYDPMMGRFITRDPIGYDGGINLNSYVNNSPIQLSDPLGLYPKIYPRTDRDKCIQLCIDERDMAFDHHFRGVWGPLDQVVTEIGLAFIFGCVKGAMVGGGVGSVIPGADTVVGAIVGCLKGGLIGVGIVLLTKIAVSGIVAYKRSIGQYRSCIKRRGCYEPCPDITSQMPALSGL